MAQSWLRTYPLRWLDWSLKFAITPFTNAKEIRVYATRGYYLLGLLSLTLLLALWRLGRLRGAFGQLPEWIRLRFISAFGKVGVTDKSLMLLLAVAVVYVVVLVLKPLRLAIGELFANFFFGTIDFGIRIGEWCLQHRWSSLFIAIALAGFISWGVYALFKYKDIEDERVQRINMMGAAFNVWLTQADNFLDRALFTGEDSDAYRRTVEPYWGENFLGGEFEAAIKLPDGQTHPAFALHKLLHEVFHESAANDYGHESAAKDNGHESATSDKWRESLEAKLPNLEKYMGEYKPHDGARGVMEERAWLLMNIFMGRAFSRLAELASKPSASSIVSPQSRREYLLSGRRYFSRVNEGFAKGYFSQIEKTSTPRYEATAHNGLGAIYSRALDPAVKDRDARAQDAREICDGKMEDCANKSLDEYAKVTDDTCSFEGRRAKNNRVILFARIGLDYDSMDTGRIKLPNNVCDPKKTGRDKIADCIEKWIDPLMACAAHEPLLAVWFTTAAQGYGASAELRRASGAPDEVQARAEAAGRYLRLSYSLRQKAQVNLEEMADWGLCYFRFTEDEKLSDVFYHAMGLAPVFAPVSGDGAGKRPSIRLEPLPAPDLDKLKAIIRWEVQKCPQTP